MLFPYVTSKRMLTNTSVFLAFLVSLLHFLLGGAEARDFRIRAQDSKEVPLAPCSLSTHPTGTERERQCWIVAS